MALVCLLGMEQASQLELGTGRQLGLDMDVLPGKGQGVALGWRRSSALALGTGQKLVGHDG